MAIAATNKTAGTGTSADSYNTASVSFTNGRLYILTVYGNATNTQAPTASSASNSWTQVLTVGWDLLSAQPRRRLTVFRCLSAATVSEVVTIDWAGVTTNAVWSLEEITGEFDASGTNGSGAIGDTDFSNPDTSATSGTVPALTLQNASSLVISAWSQKTAEAITQKTGWTELSDQFPSQYRVLEVQCLLNDPNASASWTTSNWWAGLAFEVKASAAVTVNAVAATATSQVPSSGGVPTVEINLTYTSGPST